MSAVTEVGPVDPDWREDRLLSGRLILRQPARGHRAGTDAVLLAACAPEGFAGAAVDLGAGVGAVGLALALRAPHARVRLIELDRETAAAARANAAVNDVADRVAVIEADILASKAERRAALIAAGDADLVLANPPFAAPDAGRASPDPRRRMAHVMGEGGLAGWIDAAAGLLRPRGALVLIHRADAVPDLFAALARHFGSPALRPILPRADAPAIRVVVRAVKGGRAPFALLPPLILHGPDGRFTPDVEAIHRGDSLLAWDR